LEGNFEMQEIKAPHKFTRSIKPMIFLSGSIEQGKAIDWQDQVVKSLQAEDIIILNPRRKNWNSSLEQNINNPQFKEQVEWELKALEYADIILVYFDKNTKSPITLLELGLYAKSGKIVVCCPKGFWRKGNVDILCARYNIPQVLNLKKLCKYIIGEISK